MVLMITELPSISLLLLGGLLSGATIIDLFTRRIPNELVLGLLAVALMVQVTDAGVHGAASAMGGLLVGLALLLPFYVFGGMAAGDVKLTGATAAFFGPIGAISVVLLTLLWGAIFASGVLAYRTWSPQSTEHSETAQETDWQFPYAGAICAGALSAALLQAQGLSLITWN